MHPVKIHRDWQERITFYQKNQFKIEQNWNIRQTRQVNLMWKYKGDGSVWSIRKTALMNGPRPFYSKAKVNLKVIYNREITVLEIQFSVQFHAQVHLKTVDQFP